MTEWRAPLLAAFAVAAASLIASTLLFIRDGVTAPQATLAALGPSLLFGFIGLAARYPCKVLPLRSTDISRMLLTHGGAAGVASSAWILAWNAWLPFVSGPPAGASTLIGLGVVMYALAVTLHYLLIEIETSRAAEESALRYQMLAREAELKALKAQIDPHFLFNSLNAVASLCGSRPADARQMAQLLADFFRMTLRVGPLERISLAKEIELVSRYLAIEKVRFGQRLAVEVTIEDGAGDWLVPPLLLQPLMENAVRHGVASMVEGGTVKIAASVAQGMLRIEIENPADPDRDDAGGEMIGLQNARGRLSAISGGRASLRTSETAGRFLVEIEVPR
ncbi:MAG TPA: histidine kinase [Thermoanaerobaculia bacterium]|nr:histidine kinase [Thermoanaerobaculia bacterium]